MSVQKFRGYFLYFILDNPHCAGILKMHNFRKADGAQVLRWKRQFSSNPGRYQYMGHKLNREVDTND